MKYGLSFLFLLVLAAGCSSPPVLVKTGTAKVNRSESNPNELSIAVNPANPDNIVAVSHGRGSEIGVRVTNFAYSSFDGGRSFREISLPNPEKRVQGDMSVAFDAEGNAYAVYIAFTGFRAPDKSGIFCVKSTDGGKSWQTPVAVYDLPTATPFQDKPYLEIDRTGGPHHGNIYVAWTRFSKYGSRAPGDSTDILFARSTDGGRRFSPPVVVSDKPGDALDDDGTVEGCVPAVGPGGEVYLAWAGADGIWFDKSTDGGRTFGEDVLIADMPGGWNFDVPGINRCNGMPVTGCDVSTGRRRGTIYVNWVDHRNGPDDPDVFIARSADGGRTWSAPHRVNTDARHNGAAQFFTWMAVDPADGAVYLVYYDRRGAASDSTEIAVVLAASFDGAKTFSEMALTAAPFITQKRIFFGDYIGIAARAGRIFPFWTAFADTSTLEIRVARVEKR